MLDYSFNILSFYTQRAAIIVNQVHQILFESRVSVLTLVFGVTTESMTR